MSGVGEGDLSIKDLISKNYYCNEKVISDLESGLRLDFTVEEACRHARISQDTYYRWLKESEEFNERMELAKDWIFTQAKRIWSKKITDGDEDSYKAAIELLKRRRRGMYADRQERTGLNGEPLNPKQEISNEDLKKLESKIAESLAGKVEKK